MKKVFAVILFVLLAVPLMAQPQSQAERAYIESNDFGVSFYTGFVLYEPMEYNMIRNFGINLIYHPVSFLAVEPGFFFSRVESDETNNKTGNVDSDQSTTLGGSLGLFLYNHLGGNLYLYVGPRGSYMKEDVTSFNNVDSSRSDRKGDYWGISAVIGLKFLFNDHFAVFGDFSFGYLEHEYDYTYTSSAGAVTTDRTTTEKYFTAASAVLGVTFYL